MAASATAGILVGLSWNAGDPWFDLAAGGHLWLGDRAWSPWLFITLGAVRHLAAFVGIGALWGALAARRAFPVQLLCAVGLVAAAVVLSPVLPGLVRPLPVDLRPVEALASVVAGAAGLLAGSRLFSP